MTDPAAIDAARLLAAGRRAHQTVPGLPDVRTFDDAYAVQAAFRPLWDDVVVPKRAERCLYGVGIVERPHLWKSRHRLVGAAAGCQQPGRVDCRRVSHRMAPVSTVAMDGTNTTSISTPRTITV